MFDIGWSELVVIGVVALIAIGPKELPAVLRTVGQYMGKVRRMASEFQGQFNEAMREAEMADLKTQVDEMTDTAKSFTNFDPLAEVKSGIDNFTADPLGTAASAAAETATPEVAAEIVPAPVAHEPVVPPPHSDSALVDTPVTPEALPPKAGSGA